MFKKKANKRTKKYTSISLSEKHNEQLKLFNKHRELSRELETTSSASRKEQIKKTLETLPTQDNINDYFLDNSSRLLRYFGNESDSKANILDEYLRYSKYKNYNGKILHNNPDNKCVNCSSTMILDAVTSSMICETCGSTVIVISDFDQPDFKNGHVDKVQYTYDRRHHFRNLVKQIQGKDVVPVSSDIMTKVFAEIKKRNLESSQVKSHHIRMILKKLKITKYEHVSNILVQINPDAVLQFTPVQEEKLFYMFECIQQPFAVYCPEERKNLLNYGYILHKFCQILQLDTMYDENNLLLKSRTKMVEHEKIWKQIIHDIQQMPECQMDDIDWKFYPSI
jgi:hypothetical protein